MAFPAGLYIDVNIRGHATPQESFSQCCQGLVPSKMSCKLGIVAVLQHIFFQFLRDHQQLWHFVLLLPLVMQYTPNQPQLGTTQPQVPGGCKNSSESSGMSPESSQPKIGFRSTSFCCSPLSSSGEYCCNTANAWNSASSSWITRTTGMSQEPSLGFEPTSLRLPESAVEHSTHRATRVLRRRGRQSLTRRLPHYSPFFISEWSLTALALHRCPPRHPIVARLDPQSWPALTLTPLVLGQPWRSIVACLGSRSLSALAHDFGPPWPAMGVHSEISSRNSAVQSVRSRHRDFWHQMSQEPSLWFEPTSLRLPESAIQHSTHRATRVLRWWGRQSLTRRLPHWDPSAWWRFGFCLSGGFPCCDDVTQFSCANFICEVIDLNHGIHIDFRVVQCISRAQY